MSISFNKISKSLPVTLLLLLSTFITMELTSSSLFRYSKAEEVTLPPGYTALQYLQALGQADINNDGVINLFDYATVIEEDYGKNETFIQSDVNFDQKTNAIDASFMLNHFYTDVDDERQKVFMSPQYVQEVNKEIAQRNEDKLPVSNIEDATLTITSESGGSTPEFGRNVIPTVLGTVSAYTGASSYGYDFNVPAGPGGLKPSLGLSYSSATVDDGRNQGSDGGKPFYTNQAAFIPGQVGLGFSFTGVGAIVRDTKEEKDVYKLKGSLHHRYILNLPGSVSAELKYNPSTGRWVSIPQAFLKIEHRSPGKAKLGTLTYLDPWDWKITTKDGITYYFGEEDISAKLEPNARIKGAEDITYRSDDKQRDVVNGSKNGNLYNEFDTAQLCEGASEKDPCNTREKDGRVLIVTKWLLRKVETTDGRTIDYAYDTQQKKLEQAPWENSPVEYITSSSFPKEISWNDAKHRARFIKEERPDKGGGSFMRERVKEVIVETKQQDDDQYHLVRKYVLGYFDENVNTKEKLGEKTSGEGINNDFKATFLTSVQEFGTDGVSSLPPITFLYMQFAFGTQNAHSGETYLWKINNGFGGETRFNYAPYIVGWFSPFAKGVSQSTRVRVVEKDVDDLVTGKTAFAKETFAYGESRGFAETLRKGPKGEATPTAEEFLGHASVEVKQFDFDGTLLAHSETFFNQFNQGKECNEPHPAKGQPYRQVLYRGDAKDIVQQIDTNYRYRLEGKDGQDPSAGCDRSRRDQPIFLYPYDTLSYQKEETKDFIPAAFKDKVDAKDQPKSEIRTLQRALEHDGYGNQTQAVSYGEVDKNGYDIDTTDNRYSYSYYLTAGAAWIKGLPFLTYSSNKPDCDQADLSCQWGRSMSYYDNFDKNYGELSWEQMQPRFGLLSQKQTWIDEKTVTVEGYDYDDLSGNSKDGDMRKGAVTKAYAPKPNVKNVDDPKNQVVLMSSKKYDPYYHTLLLEEKNVLGYKTLYEGYNPLLQFPTFVKKQTQINPELYSSAKLEFDAVGRPLATFIPDPDTPGFSIGQPASIMGYFERGNQGLVVRKATLVSLGSDGNPRYQTADTFYDGVGQVRQAQILQTSVDGKDVRKVSVNEYHADGKSSETYEVQTTDPVILGTMNAANYHTSINATQPQIVEVPKIVNGRVKFDALRRPVESTKIETATGQSYTSKIEYAINATKNIDSKGVEKVGVSDVWGRNRLAFVYSPSDNRALMTVDEYGKTMIDKPTKSTIIDDKEIKVESVFDYDKSGRVIYSLDPSLGPYRFAYDVYGNKLAESSQTREDNWFTYDLMGRLVKKGYDNLDGGGLYNKTVRSEVGYTYDDGPNALGKFTKVEHLTGSKTFVYDKGQRLVSTTIKTFDNQKEFVTSYNKLSQEVGSKYPDGTETKNEFDREGKVAGMFVNGEKTMGDAVYNKFGNAVQSNVFFENKTYANSTSFDSMGRVKQVAVTNPEEVFKQELSYNNAAEIEKLTDDTGGQSTAFEYGYDGFSQLTSVKSSLYNANYSYDLFGRILKKNEKDQVSMSYDAKFPFFAPKSASVAGELAGLFTIGYTNEGNMTNDENNCYFYNREGEMTKLGIKKSRDVLCTDENYKKILMFYYDEGGAMNLQEEYNPADMKKPLKQIYLFGAYEEEITN